MEVIDNGKGLPDNFDMKKTKSFGLRLVHRLTKQLQGQFNYIRNKNGSCFQITFLSSYTRKNRD